MRLEIDVRFKPQEPKPLFRIVGYAKRIDETGRRLPLCHEFRNGSTNLFCDPASDTGLFKVSCGLEGGKDHAMTPAVTAENRYPISQGNRIAFGYPFLPVA